MFKNNYYKAAVTLWIVTLGFLIAYPFHSTFWGSLLASGFSAAMIGGFADWFAVTALFRRPMGIRPGRIVRTEIIPANREKIFNALSAMVQDELLSKDNLKKHLQDYDISALIIRYLDTYGGRETASEVIQETVENLLEQISQEDLENFLAGIVKKGARDLEITPVLSEITRQMLRQGYAREIWGIAAGQLTRLLEHPVLNRFFYQVVREALHKYEGGRDRRRFAHSFIMNISPLTIAEEVCRKLIEWLRSLEPQFVEAKLGELLDRTLNNGAVQQKLESYKDQRLDELKLQPFIGNLTRKYSGLAAEKICLFVEEKFNALVEAFKADKAKQAALDSFVKGVLVEWIEVKHDEIGKLVREKLDGFSNDELVRLIESRAGNDLQIIRINGSVVGGLAGILIYLFTYWL